MKFAAARNPGQRSILKGVHVGQQVVKLLLGQLLAEAGHFLAAEADDVGHAFVIGGQPTDGQVRVPENALQSRSLLAPGGVRFVAAGAGIVVNSASRRLLRIQPQLCIGSAPLDMAGKQPCHGEQRDQCGKRCPE